MSNFTLFLELGFRHILEGYDHLLFLIGLIIVARGWRSILSVITAFTVAHSTTLVLSALGLISLPPVLTESMIALSIAYVGIENVVRTEQRNRWIVAGLFGLIHGAGFSSHLTDLLKSMLGMGQIWPPLIGFNVGIELGQLTVLAVTFPLIWLLRRSAKETAIVHEISRAIAAVGLVLVVWRIWGMGGG
jgi:hydrogenase/urease accessory protein HupE